MSQGSLGFTESQWEVLKHGPLYMLGWVGAADLRIDAAEWTALIDAVVASAADDDALVLGVMGSLAADLHKSLKEIPDGRTPIDGLREIGRILAQRPEHETHGLRVALMEIGATIADASGAQLTMTYTANHGHARWISSSGTSPMERAALREAAAALHLAVSADGAGTASPEPIIP